MFSPKAPSLEDGLNRPVRVSTGRRSELTELRRELKRTEEALRVAEEEARTRGDDEDDAAGWEDIAGKLRAELSAVELERDAYRRQLQEALAAAAARCAPPPPVEPRRALLTA